LPLDINSDCQFARLLGLRIRAAREELTRRWLDRIVARVSLEPDRVFPSEELLDHVPLLMDGIAHYVADPADEISADVPVIAKARELGELRFTQGFAAHEILREYEILGGVLYTFAAEVMAGDSTNCPPGEVIVTSHRLFRAISVIEQATTGHYLRVLAERVGEREERLRRFNRMLSHELKNHVGAVLGAGQLLREDWVAAGDVAKFADMVIENAQAIQKVMDNLVALSRLDGEARQQRNIEFPQVVTEVMRQLRELARVRKVELKAADLPRVEVNAAAVELCLSNYLSNAIKYSDPARSDRFAEVSATLVESVRGVPELVVRVRDNGLGVPVDQREQLFDRFFRGEAADGVEGTGLGLNIVRETIESLGGRAWAEFEDGVPGSVFAFALPNRRRGEGAPPETEGGARRGAGHREDVAPDRAPDHD
jgi:signal transduction histidine kinase